MQIQFNTQFSVKDSKYLSLFSIIFSPKQKWNEESITAKWPQRGSSELGF